MKTLKDLKYWILGKLEKRTCEFVEEMECKFHNCDLRSSCKVYQEENKNNEEHSTKL